MQSTASRVTENDDASANSSTSYSIQINRTAEGWVSSSRDQDWFAVDLKAGQTYTFAMVGTGAEMLQGSTLTLIGKDGRTTIAANDSGLPNGHALITFTAKESGTYYLSAKGSDGLRGQYGISATEGQKAKMDSDMLAGLLQQAGSWSDTRGEGAVVTVGFRQSSNNDDFANFSRFTDQQKKIAIKLLKGVEDFCNIKFKIVNAKGYTNDASILFGNYSENDGLGGFGYYPGEEDGDHRAGDIWINKANSDGLDFIQMHELAHALGLSHPGHYDATNGNRITYNNSAQITQDSYTETVMSYFDGSATGDKLGKILTMRPSDMLALQLMYGANMETRTGNDTYGFHSNLKGIYSFTAKSQATLVIWDAGGHDRLDLSGFRQNQRITLEDGGLSNVGGYRQNLGIAHGAFIEDAIGGWGHDHITGNARANLLDGRAGNDKLFGGAGNDRLIGAAGNDILKGGAGDDRLLAGPGVDRLFGGGEADTFVINRTVDRAIIGDFQDGLDQIDLSALGVSFARVLKGAEQQGGDIILHLPGDVTLELLGVTKGELDRDDFIF
jgi:serralysin